jgi:hypothetical protein
MEHLKLPTLRQSVESTKTFHLSDSRDFVCLGYVSSSPISLKALVSFYEGFLCAFRSG